MGGRPESYSAEEDAIIIAMIGAKVSVSAVGRALGRSKSSVSVRMFRLRQERRLEPGDPSRGGAKSTPVSWAPPISLRDDPVLVSRCLAQGGFPRAFQLGERTFWIDASGNQWAHKPKGKSALSTSEANLSTTGAGTGQEQRQWAA